MAEARKNRRERRFVPQTGLKSHKWDTRSVGGTTHSYTCPRPKR